jgi:hypothetical protein
MMTINNSVAFGTLTKEQCKAEIRRLDGLIRDSYISPPLTIIYTEQKVWWTERLGELVAAESPSFPGRKYHP